jgi:hypothetical protein
MNILIILVARDSILVRRQRFSHCGIFLLATEVEGDPRFLGGKHGLKKTLFLL